MHSRLCVRCRCALCAGVRTGTTFPPPVAVPVPAWSSRRGQCVCPLLVFDCETLVPQLNRRRSLGPRRFSVLAGGLWNRNDVARAGHTPHTAPATATARGPDSPDPPAPVLAPAIAIHFFFCVCAGVIVFFLVAARRSAAAAPWLLAHPDDGSRLTAHRAAHAHTGGTHRRGGARARSFGRTMRGCAPRRRAPRAPGPGP